jgi:tetratricopeptide (TPR) repeat protein
MTSRIHDCKRYSLDANEALEGLIDKDSKELLLKAADIPKTSWPSYYAQAEKVVSLLGSHTLALIQAGAYIAKDHCQLYEYPKVYERQRERLLKYRPEQARSRYHDVYTTFEASAEVLEQSKSEATKDALCLLTILSMLDSAVLPLQIFQSAWNGGREVLRSSYEETSAIDDMSRSHALQLPGLLIEESDEWDPFRLTEASSKLISLSLAMRHDINGSMGLSMHPLTHAWAKDRQDLEQQDTAWIATGCILGLSQSNSIMWQTQERRLLPHLQSYLNIKIGRILLFESKAIVIPILLQCGWALLAMRQDSRLSHLLEDIFAELRKNPKEPLEELLPLYSLQARSLSNIGEINMAVALLEQIVEIKGRILAETHPDRLSSQHSLAIAYKANGQVKEARALLEQVVEIKGRILVETHPHRLASQHALASAYEANGQVKEAIALLEYVMEIRGRILAETHPDRLASQHELARAYHANGQAKEAIALLEYVVEIKGRILAKTHPSRLVSQHALAIAYEANGQVKEAMALGFRRLD